MIRFEDLVEKVRGINQDADIELLRRAYVFSAFEHKGQVPARRTDRADGPAGGLTARFLVHYTDPVQAPGRSPSVPAPF